ncbi:hypothetical protein TSUD_324930 [Trifolium subterraneum]|uniref:RNase H type-1 domain-containing protein n=1 Tax=Trifolium subterraneum TaxID=3900 RepID=A0A2Z6PCU8_TRISU|nr:hypothetical protein TSUD_324930 [Trifolium subterraneum]
MARDTTLRSEPSTKTITSLQNGEHEPLLADEVISRLINDDINAFITVLPSLQEIKFAVFALNTDSAPGPDGFGAFFFQHYWDIVKDDVAKAVLEFFSSSWILPGFNSNIIALRPKSENATSIDQYRPIAMANFKSKPLAQGGLNLRSLSSLNKASNLKLCRSLLNSQSSWAKLLKDRVIRGNKIILHHIYSSILSSIKEEFSAITENSIWLLGNGEDINFWNDNWCSTPLYEQFNIPQHISQQATIPLEPSQNKLLWKHSDTGEFQLKDAYHFKHQQFQDLPWAKALCNIDIRPSKSLFVWRLMHNKVPTYENLMNQARFNNKILNWKTVISMIISCTSLSGNNTRLHSSNSIRDFTILKTFKVTIHHPKAPIIKEIIWQPPQHHWTKCNIDGACTCNSSNASCGGIFRNHDVEFMFCFVEPLGNSSPYQAELCGAMRAIERIQSYIKSTLDLDSDETLWKSESLHSERVQKLQRGQKLNKVQKLKKDQDVCKSSEAQRSSEAQGCSDAYKSYSEDEDVQKLKYEGLSEAIYSRPIRLQDIKSSSEVKEIPLVIRRATSTTLIKPDDLINDN